MTKSCERIKKYRTDKGLSQFQVVQKLKEQGIVINQSTLSRYESDKYPLTEDIIKGLSRIYNVSVIDILFDRDEQ